MEKLIPIVNKDIRGVETATCSARELHGFLGVGRDFSTWIKDRIAEFGFERGLDFEVFTRSGENSNGGRPMNEYSLTLDMAKELAMVERNDVGRKVRKYFIEVEKRAIQQLELRANRTLSIEDAKKKVKDTPSLKTLSVLQRQAVDMARRLGNAQNESERVVVYSILCYIHDAMGLATPSLEKLKGEDDG